jgi:hypothetical protein
MPLPIERETVRHAGGIGRQLGPLGQAPPAHDALVGNVAEQQRAAAPDRALGEREPAGNAIDRRVGSDEIKKTSIARF